MRTTQSGTSVTRFTIAVGRGKDQDGNDRGADFINCIAWRKLAENIAKYCTKGSQVAVGGRIQTGSYEDQDGTRRYTMDIIADNVTFLGSPIKKEESEVQVNQEVLSNVMNEDPFQSFSNEIDDGLDLPF